MSTNPYDQACRYLAKQNPAGFLAWVLKLALTAFRFRQWLDTRLLPFPGQPDRTCDTVAYLEDLLRHGLPWAVILEFQIDPDAEFFGRLLGYGGLIWTEMRPSAERGARFCIGAAVVNLRGRGNSSRQMAWPEAGLTLGLQVQEVNLADQLAGLTLAAIAAGEVAQVILPLIPLMPGGDGDDTIAEWVRLSSPEKDDRWRGDLGGLALIFAEAAGCGEKWNKALEGWNVIQSKQVQLWQAQAREEGKKEGRQEGRVEGILELLETLGPVPEYLVQTLRGISDPATLKRLHLAAAKATTLDEFRKALGS